MAPFNMKNLWGKMCLNNPKIQKKIIKSLFFKILLHGFIFPLTKKLQ